MSENQCSREKSSRLLCFSHSIAPRKSNKTTLSKIKGIHYKQQRHGFSPEITSTGSFSLKLSPPPTKKQAKIRVKPRATGDTMTPSSGKRNLLSSTPFNSAYQGYTKIRANYSANNCFFGVVLYVCIFIKISRDERYALDSTSNLKFNGSQVLTVHLYSFNKCLFDKSYLPDIMIGTGDMMVNLIMHVDHPHEIIVQ